jgi:hypothetical protein
MAKVKIHYRSLMLQAPPGLVQARCSPLLLILVISPQFAVTLPQILGQHRYSLLERRVLQRLMQELRVQALVIEPPPLPLWLSGA